MSGNKEISLSAERSPGNEQGVRDDIAYHERDDMRDPVFHERSPSESIDPPEPSSVRISCARFSATAGWVRCGWPTKSNRFQRRVAIKLIKSGAWIRAR